ncbi:MAG: hypothetical protein EHM41_02750 [Chloroflexi bacterium]|nr:MAG: hypothetical protein EHM41_02750 [Chloroflexota bacterium]
MAFDNEDVEPSVEEAGPPPEESNNRPFIIVAAILGAIMLLSLLCVAAYALLILPRRANIEAAQEATAAAQQTQVAQVAQMTRAAQLFTATPTRPRPTNTQAPTNTPVLASGSTNTPTISATERQATIQALLTQAAATAAAVSPTPTQLPQSGIFDEWNPAMLVGLGLVLVAVIAMARRMRTT